MEWPVLSVYALVNILPLVVQAGLDEFLEIPIIFFLT